MGRCIHTIAMMLLLWGCGPSGDTPTPSPPPTLVPQLTWTPILANDPSGLFMCAWAPQGGELWIVGGQADAGTLLRGPVEDLKPVALPEGTPLINWVHGSDPEDIWLVGLQGLALHWNGEAFEDHSIDIDEALWGVYAHSPAEAIAVGGASRYGGEAAVAFLWDGEVWTPIPLPDSLSALGNLLKVSFDGQSYWAVGDEGVALRGSAGTLAQVPTQTASPLVTVHGVGDKMMVVGGRGTGVILGRDEKDQLSPVAGTRAGLSGIHTLGSELAIVVGERGYAAIFDQEAGVLTEFPFETNHLLHGVYAQEGLGVLATGGDFYATEAYQGTLLWSPLPQR